MNNSIKRLFTFGIIGVFTFLLDYVIYIVLLSFGVTLSLSKFISSTIAVVVSYFLNSKYNFGKSNEVTVVGLFIYILIYIVLIAFHVFINKQLVEFTGNIHISVFVAMGISFIVNFLIINIYFNLKEKKMLLEVAKNSMFLQNVVVKLIGGIHPTIEHNIAKTELIKKALFHCDLEKIEGSYFEFGIYEGTTLYSAVNMHKKHFSTIKRKFYGFDSFDDGFKYFDEKDKHPFFKEGDFISSYEKVTKRFKKFDNVQLIKGYFEESILNKDINEICGENKCAIIFIDTDLMNPSKIALDFIKPILQEGSIIILDDYFAYKGSSNKGTAGALKQFLKSNESIVLREYYKYGQGGISFMVEKI